MDFFLSLLQTGEFSSTLISTNEAAPMLTLSSSPDISSSDWPMVSGMRNVKKKPRKLVTASMTSPFLMVTMYPRVFRF